MRYSIGSISKQFAASAILLLAEEGKLSLDDKVEKFLPGLTRGGDVTLRQLLSMTAGYQDYWPQDYVMPGMLKPVTPEEIVNRWARIPLDFEPGTAWQYSNTNYVIIGLVVQKAAGQPLFDFLQQRIFGTLGMTSIQNIDEAALGPADASRYTRMASAPVRPAPKEGRGWIFAAGELAMTASDLAKWDISLIKRTVLKPESYRALETETLLANGAGTGYGLGVSVRLQGGHRILSHGGEVSGFTAQNVVYPDDGLAVVVLTNLDATDASGRAAGKIATLLLAPARGTWSCPAGHRDPERTAARDHRPRPADGQQQLLLLGGRLEGLRGEPRAAGRADLGYAGRADAARRDDVPRVPCRVREGHRACLDLHDAGREAGAVPGRPGVSRGGAEELRHGGAENTEDSGSQEPGVSGTTETTERSRSESSRASVRGYLLCGFAAACAATRSAAFFAASGSPR